MGIGAEFHKLEEGIPQRNQLEQILAGKGRQARGDSRDHPITLKMGGELAVSKTYELGLGRGFQKPAVAASVGGGFLFHASRHVGLRGEVEVSLMDDDVENEVTALFGLQFTF